MSPHGSRRSRVVPALVFLAYAATLAGALVATSGPGALASPERDCGSLQYFESPQAFHLFLKTVPTERPWWLRGGVGAPDGSGFFGFGSGMLSGPGSGPASSVPYTGTNNQVAGVDEADLVKTDGDRIFAATEGGVAIVDAVPPEGARVLSTVRAGGLVDGMFVNGDRLAIVESGNPGMGGVHGGYRYGYRPAPTRVLVYDIGDPGNPALVRTAEVSGAYVGARMIGSHVYVVAQDAAWGSGDDLVLPSVTTDGRVRTLTRQEIGYFRDSDGGAMTTVLALDLLRDAPPSFEAFLARGGAQIYVSAESVYIAAGSPGSGWDLTSDSSTVHKLGISEGRVSYGCSARLPGTILNQFSMDEYNRHLRVATTSAGQRNNVYVLDAGMHPAGKIEGLAPGERIHSARFLGERGYLVTFKKIDPFFVIDLSDPASPRVLGYLKIPGYSDYLHPYDATHILGLGKDTDDMGSFAWFQGLKLSLFDVGDVEHPAEVAKIVIGDRGTESEALYDHHAFLFLADRGFVAFPVDLAEVDRSGGDASPSRMGTHVWQGAYVLSVDPATGIAVRARISHGGTGSYYGYAGPDSVRRALAIGDVLYTASSAMVLGHEMGGFTEVARVSLQPVGRP